MTDAAQQEVTTPVNPEAEKLKEKYQGELGLLEAIADNFGLPGVEVEADAAVEVKLEGVGFRKEQVTKVTGVLRFEDAENGVKLQQDQFLRSPTEEHAINYAEAINSSVFETLKESASAPKELVQWLQGGNKLATAKGSEVHIELEPLSQFLGSHTAGNHMVDQAKDYSMGYVGSFLQKQLNREAQQIPSQTRSIVSGIIQTRQEQAHIAVIVEHCLNAIEDPTYLPALKQENPQLFGNVMGVLQKAEQLSNIVIKDEAQWEMLKQQGQVDEAFATIAEALAEQKLAYLNEQTQQDQAAGANPLIGEIGRENPEVAEMLRPKGKGAQAEVADAEREAIDSIVQDGQESTTPSGLTVIQGGAERDAIDSLVKDGQTSTTDSGLTAVKGASHAQRVGKAGTPQRGGEEALGR